MTVDPTYADYDGELQLSPVSKRNWKTGPSRDHWQDALEACAAAYPEVEIRAILAEDNPRTAAVTTPATMPVAELLPLVAELDLAVAAGETGATVALAAEQTTADRALTAFEAEDTETLHAFYGYPECSENIDAPPIYEMACRTESSVARDGDREQILIDDPDGMLNVMWAYLGYRFISHTPCSFNCEQSRAIALSHGRIYREMGLGEQAEALWEFLSEPTTWTGYHGLSNIRNGYMIGSTNTPPYWREKTVVWGGDHLPAKL